MSTRTTILRLGPSDDGRLLSNDEYRRAEWVRPWKYERAAGRLVVLSPDSEAHDDCSEPIRDLLGAYRLGHRDVIEKVVSEAWICIEGSIDRIADIGVYLRGPRGSHRRPERVPEIVFEIVSPGAESHDRDYVQKRGECGRCGVSEYVVIDRFRRIATVFASGEGGPRERELTESADYTTPLLPGLSIPLSAVF